MNLIRIDRGNIYTPYVDGKRGETAQFQRALLPNEVEEFRKNPEGFLNGVPLEPEPEPQAA